MSQKWIAAVAASLAKVRSLRFLFSFGVGDTFDNHICWRYSNTKKSFCSIDKRKAPNHGKS